MHPAHIEDVLTALCFLQQKYQFGDRYVLVGHSCGATLAFQAVSGKWRPRSSSREYPLHDFVPPLGIAAVAGIYDLRALVESFSTISEYRVFTEAAFGKDESVWTVASPANYYMHYSWPNARVVVLADSKQDELIDSVQQRLMGENLRRQDMPKLIDQCIEISGKHDSSWYYGEEMSKVILRVLGLLEQR